jgi:hypothetical protein
MIIRLTREDSFMPDDDLPATPEKSITIIKAGHHWIFKHFFEDKDIFKELADYYDKEGYRFEPGPKATGKKGIRGYTGREL